MHPHNASYAIAKSCSQSLESCSIGIDVKHQLFHNQLGAKQVIGDQAWCGGGSVAYQVRPSVAHAHHPFPSCTFLCFKLNSRLLFHPIRERGHHDKLHLFPHELMSLFHPINKSHPHSSTYRRTLTRPLLI